MINITAFVLRFISNCREHCKLKRTPSLVCNDLSQRCTNSNLNRTQSLGCRVLLTTGELRAAKMKLIFLVQATAFMEEIKILKSNGELHNNSNIKMLHPFVDDHGILRVGGRLTQADIDYDQKHQILLPYNHHFTKTLFRYTHQNEFHAGPQLLLATIRQEFWPIK